MLPDCAPGAVTLASAFVPQTATGSIKNLVDEWLGAAAALPPEGRRRLPECARNAMAR